MFDQHRQTIVSALGLLGVIAIVVLASDLLASRAGGWRAVAGRVLREFDLFGTELLEPVQGYLRYRRELGTLTLLLGDVRTWRAADLALAQARSLLDTLTPNAATPYAAVVGNGVVGVLIAGIRVPAPPEPWRADPLGTGVWWLPIAAVDDTESVDGGPVGIRSGGVLVALGIADQFAVFLDLVGGPRATAVDGAPRLAGQVVQALAAQLDARLPSGSVFVAAGVHPGHPGPPAAETLRLAAQRTTRRDGLPAVAVFPEAPQVPAATSEPGPRTLAAGAARGHARLLHVDRDGWLIVHGTLVRVRAAPLPRAVARVIDAIPWWEWESAATAASPEPTWIVPASSTGDGLDDLDETDHVDVGLAEVGVSAAEPAGNNSETAGQRL